MHPSLFTPDDRVLLIGEGNFSFAVSLANLNLPITITASSPDSQIDLKLGKENIAYLEGKGVRVILDVNATELVDHPVLAKERFSKIIFNFPHVGGKMKIHLNRLLLEQFFCSCVNLLALNGEVWVSLCKGQGGTKAEEQPRRWDDTWQVVEMAARANLVLIAVEPFCKESFPSYTSVGYRGRDVAFNVNGALVHIFSKKNPIFQVKDTNTLSNHLKSYTLRTKFGNLNCSHLHKVRYKSNPFLKKNNPVKVLYDHLSYSFTSQRAVRTLSDDDMPLLNKDGMLRKSLLDVIDEAFKLQNGEEVILFPGVGFADMGADFNIPPVLCHVLVLGLQLAPIMKCYLNHMLQYFDRDANIKCKVHTVSSENSNLELHYQMITKANANEEINTIALQYAMRGQTVILLYVDKLAELLFDVSNWRELWVDEICVSGMKLKGMCFDSVCHVFDICFTVTPAFTENKFYNILWQLAGDIIVGVHLLSEFESSEGWKTRCYRIKYKAFDKPLCRKEAVDIHVNVIGKMISKEMDVTIF